MSQQGARGLWVGVAVAALVACGGGGDPSGDGGGVDAGPGEVDAGPEMDAGEGVDAGDVDAGAEGDDAGPGDAGLGDAGPGVVGPHPCDDALADIRTIDPATVSDAAPGEVLACAREGTLSAAELEAAITADGVTVSSGAERFLIAYRTERAPGVPGVGSARLLIPDTPRAMADAPLVVVNHGTAGHADVCAPSSRAAVDPDLALPWVASGLATITVDYAGLGTLGVQGYGDAFDTAHSVLDGARAAHQQLDDARPIVLTGHSQGGGATLFAQGLAPTYAPELDVTYAISFAGGADAPATFTAPALLPFLPITGGAGAVRAISAMSLYADYANLFGEARAGEAFDASIRDTIVTAMENDCIFDMATNLATPTSTYTPPNTLGQLVDPDLMAALQGCIRGDAACTADAMAYKDRREMNSFIEVAGAGGDVLLIGGTSDTLFTIDDYACVDESIRDTGVAFDSCLVNGATHFDIVQRGIGAALGAVLDGTVSCPTPMAVVPSCPR